MDLITKQQEIELIVNKYNDIIGGVAKRLNREHSLYSSVENIEAIQRLEEENRLLRIGIIGRVKAGKSSLLNALIFDGKSVLPKAATPMTAALTMISYGEQLSAEVDLFSSQDIDNIKNKYHEYENEKARLVEKYKEELKNKRRANKKKKNDQKSESREIDKAGNDSKEKNDSNEEIKRREISEKAEKKAINELKNKIELVSAFEQYQKIKESGIENIDQLKDEINFGASSYSELTKRLVDYVGADGKYMPFTKSVHIILPDEKLKDIQIVDTPGVNDPVQSREERTRELLKYCDVVLVVSPSGQFLSSQDTDLMDRITSKNGVRELFVVASQVDNQLSGSIKRDSNGDLHTAIDLVKDQLAKHMHSTISKLKENSPEVGDTYDQLIESSNEKIIHTSGICQTMISFWDKRSEWDDSTLHAWKNLVKHYPDFFSDSDKNLSITNLEKLSNISNVHNIIRNVRKQKDEILAKRKEEFIDTKMNSLQKYIDKLRLVIEQRLDEINNSDVSELKKKRKEINKIKTKGTIYLDAEYHLQVSGLKNSLKEILIKKLDIYYNNAKKDIGKAEGIETETWTTRGGFLWLRKDHHQRDYTTVRTGAVRSSIEELTSNIEMEINNESEEYLSKWRKQTPEKLIGTIRLHVDDEYLEREKITEAFNIVFNQIVYPELNYSGKLPETLSPRGKLIETQAENYLEEAGFYVTSLRSRILKDIQDYAEKISEVLKSVNLSQEFFSNYDAILSEMEELINNKEISIDKYNKLLNELKSI